ncbi:MAG: DUF5668 domain-containing protein [Daejeonella sp.]
MKSEKVIWGLILVFIGVIFLLSNFGIINFYWLSVWRFWPLIFIVIGANMMFSRFNNQTGTILAALVTVLVLVFVGYQGTRPHNYRSSWFRDELGDDSNDNHKRNKNKWSAINKFTEAFIPNTQKAELTINGGATSYELKDTTSSLFDAEADQRFGSYILEKVSRDSMEILTFKMQDGKRKLNIDAMDGNEAKIRLNNKPNWDINVKVGAGEVDFDLTPFKINNLQLQGGAASFDIKLPMPQTISNITVDTGVAEVKIQIPFAAECRIKVDSGFSSRDFDGFTKQADGTFTTPNYNKSAKKINISLRGGLSSFEVDRY